MTLQNLLKLINILDLPKIQNKVTFHNKYYVLQNVVHRQ